MMRYAADCGNAILDQISHERYYKISGPELGEIEGQIISTAGSIYGQWSNVTRWHDILSQKEKRLDLF